MGKKVLFVGAGAIGSYLGAFLARAGHDVTIVDAVGRAGRDHPPAGHLGDRAARSVRRRGPRPCTCTRPQRLPRDFEIAFIAMKVYDTAWATQLALRHLTPDGLRRLVAELLARSRSWPPCRAPTARSGLIMSKIGVACWKPGEVERGMEKGGAKGHDVFRAGEHDGAITPRVEELAEMLKVVDGSLATDNLWGERWSKLCANAMGNPVQGMSGLGSFEIASSEVGRAITIHLAAESARVGLAPATRIPKINGETAEHWADAGRRET